MLGSAVPGSPQLLPLSIKTDRCCDTCFNINTPYHRIVTFETPDDVQRSIDLSRMKTDSSKLSKLRLRAHKVVSGYATSRRTSATSSWMQDVRAKLMSEFDVFSAANASQWSSGGRAP